MKYAREMVVPAMVCAITFATGLILANRVGLRGTTALDAFYLVSANGTVLTFLVWCGAPFFRQPEFRALSPTKAALAFLRDRWLLLLMPCVIGPVFNTGFTLAKTAFPFIVGYHWDHAFAELDRLIFGQDAWRLTHAFIGREGTRFLATMYTFVWGALFVLLPRIVLFFGSPELAIRFATARMLTWFFGGVFGAAALSSAGPIFAGLVDPTLGQHFAPLQASLYQLMAHDDVILQSQGFLRAMFGTQKAIEGAGISAMPSMHLATCTLYVLLAWPTRWRIASILFWLTIWVGSIHFGYHYAVDGLIGALIAMLMWGLVAPRRGLAPTEPPAARDCPRVRWPRWRAPLPLPAGTL